MTVTQFVGTKVTAKVINERDGLYVGLFDSHRLAHVQDYATAVGIVTPSGFAVLLDLHQIGHRVLWSGRQVPGALAYCLKAAGSSIALHLLRGR